VDKGKTARRDKPLYFIAGFRAAPRAVFGAAICRRPATIARDRARSAQSRHGVRAACRARAPGVAARRARRPRAVLARAMRRRERLVTGSPTRYSYTHFFQPNSGGNHLFALIEAAGWPIWFLIVASVFAVAIIGERLWTLRAAQVAPRDLLPKVVQEYKKNGVTEELLSKLNRGPALGRVFAAGLRNLQSSREVLRDSVEEAGRLASQDLDRFLTTLGSIATVAPLLGLFGTVVGMIEIFGSQTPSGSNPIQLGHGISIALYNTAFGILVAVPSMIFYRYFRARVDAMVVEMEQQAIKLVEVLAGERRA
jgi:biopolymer transport protein ExbB